MLKDDDHKGRYKCETPGADSLIKLPRKLREFLALPGPDSGEAYTARGRFGKGIVQWKDFATFWVGEVNSKRHLYLHCQAGANHEEIGTILRSLTLAVGNSKSGKMYLCHLRAEKRGEKQVALTVEQRKASWPAAWSCPNNKTSFSYAWPGLLEVKIAGKHCGTPSANQGLDVKLARWTVHIEPFGRGGETLTVVLPDALPREIEEKLRTGDKAIKRARNRHKPDRPFPWAEWWRDLDAAVKDARGNSGACKGKIDGLKGKKNKEKNKGKQIETLEERKAGWDSVLTALVGAKGLRDEISGAFQKNKLTFLDPMGRTIHEIRFELKWGGK